MKREKADSPQRPQVAAEGCSIRWCPEFALSLVTAGSKPLRTKSLVGHLEMKVVVEGGRTVNFRCFSRGMTCDQR